MHLEGSFETPASRKVAYDFLLNPNDIAPCLPDLQSVEVLSPDSFRAKVKVGIGLVKGNMDFAFRVIDKVPRLLLSSWGRGGELEVQLIFKLGSNWRNWDPDAR